MYMLDQTMICYFRLSDEKALLNGVFYDLHLARGYIHVPLADGSTETGGLVILGLRAGLHWLYDVCLGAYHWQTAGR